MSKISNDPFGKQTNKYEIDKRRLKITDSPLFDFGKAINEHGILKARQMLKQTSILSHQADIDKIDAESYKSRENLRLKQAIKLSRTLGGPSEESVIDKLVNAAITEQNAKSIYGHLPVNAPKDLPKSEVIEPPRDLDVEIAVKRSLIADDGELMIPQFGIDSLPITLGDTLFVQIGHLRSLSLPRNQLNAFLSHHLPQMSMYHFRYVQSMNLSGNNIKYLPFDFGKLTELRDLNISFNSMSMLPKSISKLTKMTILNLSNNNFAFLNDEIGEMAVLESLNLSKNLLTRIPSQVIKIRSLKFLDLSHNSLAHLSIIPPLLKPGDLWTRAINTKTGKMDYVNVLTRERVSNPANYSGNGISRAVELHSFQRQGTLAYRRRKIWLSICQVCSKIFESYARVLFDTVGINMWILCH